MDNPYQTESIDAPPIKAELYVAEAVPDSEPRLPQPGLPLAFALTLSPLMLQLVAGVAIMTVVAVVLVARGVKPNELHANLLQYEAVLLPVATFLTVLIALGIAIVMFGRDAGRVIGWRGVTWQQLLGLVLFVFPLAILASEATNILAEVLGLIEPAWLADFRQSGAATFDKFAQFAFPIVLVAGALLPGLGEEILCRGVISRGLIARHGVIAGTLWASFLFGAMHIEPVQSFGAFLLGLGLQFVFLTTRSLAAPIFCHAVNNGFAFLLMKNREDLPLPGISSAPDEGLHIPFAVLVTSVLALALASALMVNLRTRWLLPDGSQWTPGYVSAELPPKSVNATAVTRPASPLLLAATLAAFAAMIVTVVMQVV